MAVRASLAAAALLAVLARPGERAQPASAGTDAEPFVLRVPVLTYHRITCAGPDADFPELWVCPDRFLAQLDALRAAGWTTVTADELADRFSERDELPPRTFVITIDDGHEDGYRQAAPILAQLGMTATYYIITGKTGACEARTRRITWCELRELRDAGHGVGNHSVSHERPVAMTDARLAWEVEAAQTAFEAELGWRPSTFAYPYGAYDARYLAAVEASDITLAFTYHGPGGPPGEWVDDAYVGEDRPFEAERITVYPTDEPAALVAKLQPFANDIVTAASGSPRAPGRDPVPEP